MKKEDFEDMIIEIRWVFDEVFENVKELYIKCEELSEELSEYYKNQF